MAGATEAFKLGLKPTCKPTEKNITAATVEKMRAGATEDFKPGIHVQSKPNEKNIAAATPVEEMMAGARQVQPKILSQGSRLRLVRRTS